MVVDLEGGGDDERQRRAPLMGGGWRANLAGRGRVRHPGEAAGDEDDNGWCWEGDEAEREAVQGGGQR